MTTTGGKWDWDNTAKTSYWGFKPSELYSFRHLLFSLVRREFLLSYQQTLLGPFWIVFQPLVTLITYILVFTKMIGISIGSIPPVLFYFSGILLWNFFSDSFGGIYNTFRDNIQLFSKVYFPRIIMPVSFLCTHFIKFLIQLVFLLLMIIYYLIFKGLTINFGLILLAFPLAVLCVGVISLSVGLIVSVLTAKYRDIGNLITLVIRLLMFVTPVIFPLAVIPASVRWIVLINPLTPLFELFRYSLFGEGTVTILQVLYSLSFTIIILPLSLMFFNKNGSKLIDVV
jgi:lipopolysaccharide transport system permease protein